METYPNQRGDRRGTVTVHGHARVGRKTRAYLTWKDMRRRCLRENRKDYKHYGGRGIAICDRWDSFSAFLEDMGEPPEGMSLGRIDNDRGYSPENCRWETPEQQFNNRRSTRFVEAFGERMSVTQWAKKSGIGKRTILMRLNRGWLPELAVSEPTVR